MTLQEIINLKEGATFRYQGKPAKVVWRYYNEEYVGDREDKGKDGKPSKITKCFKKDFCVYFTFENTGITLTSTFPHPAALELSDYQL